MAYYRLYMLSGANGRFVGFEEIEAADDSEALRLAEPFQGDKPLELWCGSRKVRSIPALPKDTKAADLQPGSASGRPGRLPHGS